MKSWVIKNSKDINIQGVPKSSCLISSLIIIDNPIEYFHSRAGGGGVLHYMAYMGICRWTGYGFLSLYP